MSESQSQQYKLLLIDHESEVCKQITELLAPLNLLIEVEPSAEKALNLWRSKQHQLVICEAKLQATSGLNILKHISEENPDTQVIIISEAGEMEDVVAALRLGAADFIMKPIDSTILTHAVSRGLDDFKLKEDNRQYREQLEVRNKELKESLRLLREDQEAGRAVQLKLLPPFEGEFQDLKLQFSILPSLYLSGDFIDYFKISDDKFGFYLADVSGHGASSAFITILLKTMANRLRQRYRTEKLPELTPAKILSLANQELIPLGLGKHLAVFCAIIDTKNSEICYCSAAHFPPPILMNGPRLTQLKGKGLPVGLFEGIEYEELTVPLNDTFKLILFSDGVLELIDLPTVADKETFLMEMVKKGTHNIRSISEYLGIEGIQAAPDDIAVLTVSRGR